MEVPHSYPPPQFTKAKTVEDEGLFRLAPIINSLEKESGSQILVAPFCGAPAGGNAPAEEKVKVISFVLVQRWTLAALALMHCPLTKPSDYPTPIHPVPSKKGEEKKKQQCHPPLLPPKKAFIS